MYEQLIEEVFFTFKEGVLDIFSPWIKKDKFNFDTFFITHKDELKNKEFSGFTFLYWDKVSKVFLYEKYYRRYLFNYSEYYSSFFNKVKMINHGKRGNIFYIDFEVIEKQENRELDMGFIFDYKKKLFSGFDIFPVVYFINLPFKKVNNLYEFFLYFLIFVKERRWIKDIFLFNRILLLLKNNKQDFESEKYLYFVHGDLSEEHFLYSLDKKSYIIDFWNSGYFDYYYDFIGFNRHLNVSLDDIKHAFLEKWIYFSEKRFYFNLLLYDLID